jgi:recombination protein RecT
MHTAKFIWKHIVFCRNRVAVEQFGFILPYKQKGVLEATPIIGYKGLVEIAYRNPKMKSLRIQAVYENDEFSYEYGTEEYIKHKPTHSNRGALQAVYAIAKMEGIDPMFVVVHKDELIKIQKLAKSGGSEYSAYNNGLDVFNVMQSKVALKLLFKTLPKTDNEILIKTLELDNKFDYDKSVRIEANEHGYEIIENEETKQSAMQEKEMEAIEVTQTEAHKELTKN